jgi:hypothetical protein
MMDLSDRLDSMTRFRILMQLRQLSPNDKFDEAFNEWALENYGLRMIYDMPARPGALTGTDISDEDFTALLLKVDV